MYTKGYFLPADSPDVILEWAYQHPFYAPHQIIGLVKVKIRVNPIVEKIGVKILTFTQLLKALTSRGAGGGKLSATLSKIKGGGGGNSLQVKQLIAQVTEACENSHSVPSATMTLDMLVNAR
jgi:hypothetical protein